MAYDPDQLSVMASNNGFTLWHYRTPDLVRDVIAPDYFKDAAHLLRPGDFVFANIRIDQPYHFLLCVRQLTPDVQVYSIAPY